MPYYLQPSKNYVGEYFQQIFGVFSFSQKLPSQIGGLLNAPLHKQLNSDLFIQKVIALGKVKVSIFWQVLETFWLFSNTTLPNLSFWFQSKAQGMESSRAWEATSIVFHMIFILFFKKIFKSQTIRSIEEILWSEKSLRNVFLYKLLRP